MGWNQGSFLNYVCISVLFLVSLSGCAPQTPQQAAEAATSALPSALPLSPSSAEPHKKSGEVSAAMTGDLVFSYSGIDPQAGEACDTGTITVSGVLCKESDGYRGEVSVRRQLQSDGLAQEIWYDSADFRTETVEQTGILPMQIYFCQRAETVSTFFDVPIRATIRRGSTEEITYALKTDSGKTTLTLRLNDAAVVVVEGKPGTVPLPAPVAMPDVSHILVSDRFFTADLADRDIYRVLCSATKTEDSYAGNLRLSRTGETYRMGTYTTTGKGESWEEPFSFRFVPFDEAAYREAGGKMGRFLTATLSNMGIAQAGSHTAIFTVSGETVFLELPGEHVTGYFLGAFDGRSDAQRIAQEELVMWQQDHIFRTRPQADTGDSDEFMASLMEGAALTGVEYTQEELEVFQNTYENRANELTGQALWLPPDFVPMPNAIDIGEMPPSGDMQGIFDYTMQGLYLDETVPMLVAQFEGMRNFQYQEGEYTSGHYGVTLQFDYGGYHMDVSMSQTLLLGTTVGIDVCRND